MGTFFVLRHAIAARALHGQQTAAPRTHRAHRRVRSISPPTREHLSRALVGAGASLGHFRTLHRPRLSTPIAGGLIADRVLGRTRTITIGALLMAAGHFLMAFDLSFLLALVFLLAGVGCFKGNLASQVGAVYRKGDNRSADAFQIAYFFMNGGVIAAPLIAGTLGEKVGWHYGFGAAGVGMLIGLTIYLAGRKYLPPDSPVVEKSASAPKPRLSKRELTAILLL